MLDYTVEEEFDPGRIYFTDYRQFGESCNLLSLGPFLPDEDSNFEEINMASSEETTIKRPVKVKKRQAKYDRLGHEAHRDQRDVKKYARADTISTIIQKYSKIESKSYHIHQKLTEENGVSKRSLKYYFIVLGVLKMEGELEKFHDFFEQHAEATLKAKYASRSEGFKNLLMKSISYSKKAIELFLDENESFAIEVAYTESEFGGKGRTKNPTEMEKCRKFYESIFTISHNRSNKSDLDMLLI